MVVIEPFSDLFIRHVPVLDREGVDAGLEEELRGLEPLPVFLKGKNHCIVHLDKLQEIFPYLLVRTGEIQVAPPHPGTVFLVVRHHRKGLRVVNDNEIMVVQMVPDGILMDDVLVDPAFPG